MKKKLLFIVCLTLVMALSFTGCTQSSRQKRIDARDVTLENVASAIDSDEVGELYELYAPVVQQENQELEAQLRELVDYIEGDYVSAKQTHSSSQDRSGEENNYKSRVIYSYEITTTATVYEVTWRYNTQATDENYVGLMSLGVQKKSELSKDSPMTVDQDGAYVIK